MKTKKNQYTKIKALILLTVYTFALSSCNFYKISEVNTNEENAVQAAKNSDQTVYYVLHVGDNVWGLNNVKTTAYGLSGTLSQVNEKAWSYYLNATTGGILKYENYLEPYIYQAHIFASEFKKQDNEVTVTNEQITKLYILDRNSKKSARATGGIVAGTIVGGLGVFLLIACNCPHVYVFDGETYYYNNTLFTGATSSVIERSDFKLMPDYFPASTEYKLKIVNEDNEIQKIDQTKLIVIEHDQNSEVVADQNGFMYELKDLNLPISAVADGHEDLKNAVSYYDGESHNFDNKSAENFSNLYVNFKTPMDKENAKLVLRAKNSLWLSYVYKSFTELFGKHYNKWVKSNHKKSKEEVYAALKEEGIPLIVSIKRGDEWIDIETIHPVGDVNFNSIVIPIDQALISGEEIQVRLRSGFMFWNVDQIAFDNTPQTKLSVQHILPNQTDKTENVLADDEQYLVLEKNDSITLNFSGLTVSENLKRTIILKSNGHYLPLMSQYGKANKTELAKFKKGGEMTMYSRRLYQECFGNMEITFNN